jgi:hypothetical protein
MPMPIALPHHLCALHPDAFFSHITNTPSLFGIHYPYSNCDTSLCGSLAFDLVREGGQERRHPRLAGGGD